MAINNSIIESNFRFLLEYEIKRCSKLNQELINDYDKNGNIKGLKRQAKSFGSPITVDNLTYTYNGNQLTGVDDAIAKSYDYYFFDNGHYYYITRTPEYLYDANGNLTQDLNKEIVNISYNELNLPKVIDFKNNSRIEYQYDALGVKKRQLVTEGGKLVKTTDFIGNYVYENNYQVYNSFDEGRIIYGANGIYFAETYIKDHLGNIRVAYGNESTGDTQQYGIRQLNAYYPFGMNINPLTANKISKYKRNEFLYNGKMFQDELGLDWLDYGARFYDGVIGRWHSVDPCADEEGQEVASPYSYVEDNPIIRIDPNGKIWGPIIGAVAGAVAEYTGQVVASSIKDGGFSVENLYKDIDLADLGLSTVEGALTSGGSVVKGFAKAGVVVGSEIARNAIDATISEGVTINGVRETAKNTAIGLSLGKIGDAAPAPKVKVVNTLTPKQAVKQARQEAKASGTVVNREKRIATETQAKSNQAKAKGANEAAGKTLQNSAASSASETTKKLTDEKKR